MKDVKTGLVPADVPTPGQIILRVLSELTAQSAADVMTRAFDIKDSKTESLFALRKERDNLIMESKEITEINEDETYKTAISIKKRLVGNKGSVVKYFESFAQIGAAIHRAITQKRTVESQPAITEATRLANAIGVYEKWLIQEERRKERERELLRIEQEKIIEAETMKLAEKFEEAGKPGLAAQVIEEMPIPATAAPTPIKTVTRETVSFKVTNWDKFFAALSAGLFKNVSIADVVTAEMINRGRVHGCLQKETSQGDDPDRGIFIYRGRG